MTGLGAVCTRTRFQWLFPGFQKNSTGAETRCRSEVQRRGRRASGAQAREGLPPSPAGAVVGLSVVGLSVAGVGMVGSADGEGLRLGSGAPVAEGGVGDLLRLAAGRAGVAPTALPAVAALDPLLLGRWAAAD